MDIKGKVFAITGASSGLGLATAKMILDQGGAVIGIDLKSSGSELDGYEKDRWKVFNGDDQSPDEVRRCLMDGLEHLKKLHGAIACAGITQATRLESDK